MAISNFDALMRLNDCLLTAGKHHEAIAMLTDAISKSPDSRLYFKRGFHHEQLNHAEDAIGDYSSAIEIEPNNPSYHLSRGCVLSHALESNIEAIEDFETVLRLDPNNLEAHRECCLCLLLVDQATKALSHANSAIRLSVSDSASHYCAGETLLALDQYERAADALLSAVELDASKPHYWARLGYAYERSTRENAYELAISAYQTAISLAPDSPLYYLSCGEVFFKMKRYVESLSAYQRVLQLNPNELTRLLANHGIAQLPVQ